MEISSKSKHVIELSLEIIDNIELSQCDAESILLKATRLSIYIDNEEIRNWLRFEMHGYNSTNETSVKYMGKTGRWTNKEKTEGYWSTLAQIEGAIETSNDKLKILRIPDLQTDYANIVVNNITGQISAISVHINKLRGIKSKVTSLIHDFATTVYYERVFDNLSESIFEEYKKQIDLLIAENLGDVIEQIPAVISRLSDQEKESISQALTTCRRIIDSFANHIFPPSDETMNIDGNEISLKHDKTLNRINAYVINNCDSKSRKKKIRQNLSNLYERVSTGVHSDVDAHEARNLFFNTYLLLGEILTLKK